jgi:hypothetical protein
MPRRIDVELTSERPDGTWTWRAAGARQPKGEVDASVLPPDAKVGVVLRAEADFNIDGIEILSIVPTKGERREPERIEIIGSQREFTPVTSQLPSAATARRVVATTARVRRDLLRLAPSAPVASGRRRHRRSPSRRSCGPDAPTATPC